jgi:hypothetical protein
MLHSYVSTCTDCGVTLRLQGVDDVSTCREWYNALDVCLPDSLSWLSENLADQVKRWCDSRRELALYEGKIASFDSVKNKIAE